MEPCGWAEPWSQELIVGMAINGAMLLDGAMEMGEAMGFIEATG